MTADPYDPRSRIRNVCFFKWTIMAWERKGMKEEAGVMTRYSDYRNFWWSRSGVQPLRMHGILDCVDDLTMMQTWQRNQRNIPCHSENSSANEQLAAL
jgi:hypothetical protein